MVYDYIFSHRDNREYYLYYGVIGELRLQEDSSSALRHNLGHFADRCSSSVLANRKRIFPSTLGPSEEIHPQQKTTF